jgi:hypothetical protein
LVEKKEGRRDEAMFYGMEHGVERAGAELVSMPR